MTFFDNELGNPEGSKWGTFKCATITALVPALMPCAKGSKSVERNVASECDTVGNSMCESLSVSPCPGKCFTQLNVPVLSIPLIKAAVCCATKFVSEPKARKPITGFLASKLMSASGEKLK